MPATAIPLLNRINSDNISALGMMGILLSNADLNSIFCLDIAPETTNTSIPLIFETKCLLNILIPIFFKCFTEFDSVISDPVTKNPNVCITSAIPLIPEPPIPTKCIFFILFFIY